MKLGGWLRWLISLVLTGLLLGHLVATLPGVWLYARGGLQSETAKEPRS